MKETDVYSDVLIFFYNWTCKETFVKINRCRKFWLKNDPVKRLTISQGTSMHHKVSSTILKCDFAKVSSYESAS